MTSLHLVDPELKSFLEMFPTFNLSLATLPEIRTQITAMLNMAPAETTNETDVETFIVPERVGVPACRVLQYRPARRKEPLPAILHIHGGGYVMGAPEMMDNAHRILASELNCAIFSVDYRLAPETIHPGQLEDCFSVLEWLYNSSERLRIDRARLGLKGESAGGGLAAGLALLARDRGGPPLAFQHLIYPMLDDRTCVRPDLNPASGEFIWTRDNNVFGWSSLLGVAPGGNATSFYAAAARATDLGDLPPTFISAGGLDLFLEEDVDYAMRLGRAGVAVELHVYPGAIHGFQMASAARVGRAAERESRESLRRGLYG